MTTKPFVFAILTFATLFLKCSGSPNPWPSRITSLCAVMQRRFISADDIPESQQKESLQSLKPAQESDICSGEADRIHSIINQLDKAVTYFGTLKYLKYNQPVLATRSIQAQIALVLEYIQASNATHVAPGLLDQLKALEAHCKTVAILLEDQNSRNWNLADQTTTKSFYWKSPQTWKPWSILGSKELSPALQFKNLTHYYRNHVPNNECHMRMTRDCDLTQECANILMNRSAEITTLAHDIEFFKTAIKLECVEEVEFVDKFPDSNWKIVVEDHCTKMWNEANAVSNAKYPKGYKSIFLVHGSMCALVGFPNFLRVDWINDILSWMSATANGCIAPDTKSGEGEFGYGFDDLAANGEWCTIYETSVGMEILAMHLRYVLETCYGDKA